MKQEDRLKIQAWLDGELAPQESARIADLIDNDLEAKELADDLRAIQKALEVGEKQTVLEDSREFYWSQVERQIEAEEPITENAQPELVSGSLGNALRWLIPVGSLAAISALMLNFDSINTTRICLKPADRKSRSPTSPVNPPAASQKAPGRFGGGIPRNTRSGRIQL